MNSGPDPFRLSSPPPASLLDPFLKIDLSGRRAILIAVSGGSDSTALLLLAKVWLRRSHERVKLRAVTVDHKLRPESAAEARTVGALCEKLGVAHRIVRWDDPKPRSGLAEAARTARYRLLAEVAQAAGADFVLTGHTLDDQVETGLMRQARAEGRGLAGMAPATLFQGRTWVVRPLLSVRRRELRVFLEQNAIGWIEDPTNVDLRYERARTRARLCHASAEFADMAARIAEAQHERVDAGRRAAAIIRNDARRPSSGLVRLPRDLASNADREGALYALRVLLAAVGGTAHLPDEVRSGELLSRLKGGARRATLSRAVIEVRGDGFYLRRELRNLPVIQEPRDGTLWDGRFRIEAGVQPPGVSIAPLGQERARELAPAVDGVPRGLVRAAFAAEPALWKGVECLGVAAGSDPDLPLRVTPVVAPWADFLPSFDLAPAAATALLLGAQDVPAPPLPSHNATSP